MAELPTRCPFCQSALVATELHCTGCETVFRGDFDLGPFAPFHPEQLPVLQRLARLTPEQLQFVETFLLSEGKLRRVEEKMGLSYPSVRARLNQVLERLTAEEQ